MHMYIYVYIYVQIHFGQNRPYLMTKYMYIHVYMTVSTENATFTKSTTSRNSHSWVSRGTNPN